MQICMAFVRMVPRRFVNDVYTLFPITFSLAFPSSAGYHVDTESCAYVGRLDRADASAPMDDCHQLALALGADTIAVQHRSSTEQRCYFHRCERADKLKGSTANG